LTIILVLLVSCKNSGQSKKESFINLNGNKIHVKTSGNGRPIIFVHGGYLDLEMWNSQIMELKDTYQTIRFSDLGHGKTISSKKPIFGYDIINELTNKYPYDKFVLVGLSWGAMLSVDFALNYPDKVDKLILVSPGLNGWTYFQDSIASRNNKLRQKSIEDSDTLKAAKLFHQNWVIGPRRKKSDLDSRFYVHSLEMITKTMRKHKLENWSQLDTIPAITRLENIQPKTYIIIGREDATDILLIAEEYHKRINHSKKIELDSVAHLLNMETKAKFNRILKEILDE